MATVRITLDVGAGSTLGGLARAVEDLSVVMDLGLRIDMEASRRLAEDNLERLWRDQPDALTERVLGWDEPAAANLHSLLEQRQLWEDLLFEGRRPPASLEDWNRLRLYVRRFGMVNPFIGGAPFAATLKSSAPDVFAALAANDAARIAPEAPNVGSLHYENPLDLVLLGVAGVIGAGFKYGTFVELVKLLRDWSIDKDHARANVEKTRAETREANARASQIEFETQLRKAAATQLQGTPPELLEAAFDGLEIEALRGLSRTAIEMTVDEDAEAE